MKRLIFKYSTFDEAILPQLKTGEVITCRPKNNTSYSVGDKVNICRRYNTKARGVITKVIPFGDGSRQLTVKLTDYVNQS